MILREGKREQVISNGEDEAMKLEEKERMGQIDEKEKNVADF